MEKGLKPKEGRFYVAYACRHWASLEDVDLSKPFTTYKQASKYGSRRLCDDDNYDVLWFKKGKWWKLLKSGWVEYERWTEVFINETKAKRTNI